MTAEIDRSSRLRSDVVGDEEDHFKYSMHHLLFCIIIHARWTLIKVSGNFLKIMD